MAASDARPQPLKNTAYRVYFPIYDADGDPVSGAAGLDSEVSKDGGTFADCTNEATEIATSSGVYYLDLTSTEMNADATVITVKTSTSGAKTTVIVLYPAETTDIPVNVTAWSGTAVATPDTAGYPKVTIKSGTGTGEINLSSGRADANATYIAGSAVNTSAAQLGVNVVNAGGTAWASGSITAGVIGPDAIGASELAADAATEIGTAVWATAARTLTGATNVTSTGVAVPITAGGLVSADVTAISTDTTAANNAESFFDGTGYAGTNNTIPAVTTVGSVSGSVGGSVGSVSGAVGSVTGGVGGNVAGSVGSLAAQAKLDVNAEVVDALATDTHAEPNSVPAATTSIVVMLHWLYTLARNKRLTTATTDTIRNDADSSDIGTAVLSDGGTTFTRGEYA